MIRTKININLNEYPNFLLPYLKDAEIYDSSCSKQAKVIFIDKDQGYYLKSAEKGSLKREAIMDRYFYQKGFGAAVCAYLSADRDWLLTERAEGEDCCDPLYMAEPEQLCVLYAKTLRMLHETDGSDCPIQDRTAEYLQTVERNYKAGIFDTDYLPKEAQFADAESAYRFAMEHAHLLKRDTLIHGDYCLPNVLLHNWKFSKFIDLGNGGIADRHIDLFWGIWTLNFNFKTDKFRDLFLDAYGRDKIDESLFRVIGAMECFG